MEAVYNWVKGIIYFMLFLAVAGNLLAEAKYERYIRFFAGIVLILLVVSPFAGGFRLEEQAARLFESISLEMDTQDLKKDLWGMEDKRREQVIGRYEEAVENDIVRIAENQGLTCSQVRVSIEKDSGSSRYGQVRSVWMMVEKNEEDGWNNAENGGQDGKEWEAGRKKKIEVEKIEVGNVGEWAVKDTSAAAKAANVSDSQQPPDPVREKIGSLKGKVAQYYELEETDIKIQWKND